MNKVYEAMEEEQNAPMEGVGGVGETGDAQCSPEKQLTDEGVSREYDDATFATLLALVPLLVFTLFGQIGLF